MSRLAKGGLGSGRANPSNPPPSDPGPARQVTFQVAYGVGWGANQANQGLGGAGGSVSWVEHREPVVGHGLQCSPGQLLFEEWRSTNIYCSNVVLAKRSSDILASSSGAR